MRKARTVKFDSESEERIRKLAGNKEFVMNMQSAALTALYESKLISKQQFDLCLLKLHK